jgi:hypothetical protein
VVAEQGRSFGELKSRMDTYIDERLKTITNLRGDLGFVFAAVVHLTSVLREKQPGSGSIENFVITWPAPQNLIHPL